MTISERYATLLLGELSAGTYRGSQLELIEGLIRGACEETRREAFEQAADAANNMGQYDARNWCLFKAKETLSC